MASFHEFFDGVSRLPTQAVQARARCFGFFGLVATKWDGATVGLEGFVGNPPSFSSGRSNPGSRRSAFVEYPKSPFCVQLKNVTVKNCDRCERVNDYQETCLENYLWSNPKCVCTKCCREAHYQLDHDHERLGLRHETVCRKEGREQPRYISPNKIDLGSKNSLHVPIISGDMQ